MASLCNYPLDYIHQTNEKATAAYIFLHGMGQTGSTAKKIFLSLLGEKAKFPHVKIVFPTAPCKYFKVHRKFTNVWFNIERTYSAEIKFCEKDLNETSKYLESLIQDLESQGIPRNRIILGGWSQGGMMAMYAGLTKITDIINGVAIIAGMFSFGDNQLPSRKEHPAFIICQSSRDQVYYSLPRMLRTAEELKSRGVQTCVRLIDSDSHEITEDALKYIYCWITQRIPLSQS